MSLKQGVFKVNTPITTDIIGGRITFISSGHCLHLPKGINGVDAEIIKKYLDHVYNVGLSNGFQLAKENENT